jgi:thioredoxin reductase (NADPH)
MKESEAIVKTPCIVEALEKSDEGKLQAIILKNRETKESERIEVSGLFVAVGQTPDTAIFDLNKDEKGYIITDENMKTDIEGVFAAGDCRAKFLRQIVTATADGAIAAEQAVLYVTLNNK